MVTHKNGYWLGLIILVALVLRLYPHAQFGTDGITFVGTCGQMIDEVKPLVNSGNILNFENFYYPTVGPLIVASTALVVKAAFPQAFDVSLYCLFVTIAFSVGTLLVLYLIARRWGEFVGQVSTAFFAVTMIAVDCSDTVQVYETFFAMLAVYFFLQSLDHPTFANLTLMGAFLGLSIASKYFSATLIPMFVVAHVLLMRSRASLQAEGDHRHWWSIQGIGNSGWKVITYGALATAALALYGATIHKNIALDFVKGIYNAHEHEHPFEFHLDAVNRYYALVILALVSSAAAITAIISIPFAKGMDQWEWFKAFCWSNRFWLTPSFAMAVILLVVMGVPVALNLNNFAAYSSFLRKAYATGDGAIFPAGHPAPSYFVSYFPESLGFPLFVLSCAGILVTIYARDRTGIIVLGLFLPMYLMLEQSSVRVNRYALDIMPIMCLFAALALKYLSSLNRSRLFRLVPLIAFSAIFTYSVVYSIAWANFKRSVHSIPLRAEEWIHSQVQGGSEIGMRSSIWIPGSPQLILDPERLQAYKIVDYKDNPEYVVLPHLLYDVAAQLEVLTETGYKYTANDWFPQLPPPPEDIDVLVELIHEKRYSLVKTFEVFPSFAGITFTSEVFGGKTWQLEHAGPYGIRIYKRKEH